MFFNFYWRIVANNVVLVSAAEQRDSIIHIYIFIFFSIMVYHRILSIGTCAIQ